MEEPISPVVAPPGSNLPQITVNGDGDDDAKAAGVANGTANGKVVDDKAAAVPPADTRDFKELSCVEMMDAITRNLVKWQNRFEAL